MATSPLSITPEALKSLYDDLTSQGYSHDVLVNAARQNYGIDLDQALKSSAPISYADKINSGPLEKAAQPTYAEYQASLPAAKSTVPGTDLTYTRTSDDTSWLSNVRQGYGPQGQGARTEEQIPSLYRDPDSGYGVGVEMEDGQVQKLVYYDPQGRKLRSSIFTAPELYKNANEFGINLSGIGSLGTALDAAGIKYKPGELYAGVGSNLGINFNDIAAGKLGAAYDWTQDPFASTKGPYGSQTLAENQNIARTLNVKPELSENLATIDPYKGPTGTRNFAVVIPSISGSPTVAYYATAEEAEAAKYLYGGTLYNVAESPLDVGNDGTVTTSQNATASAPLGALSTATNTAPATGALPTSGFDAFGNPRGNTWTEDRYNPNDPASSSYIADPNAGRYVFDPATGKHTLVPSTGATSVTGATGNDTVTGALDTASRFYDPVLKSNWEIENVGDLGLANDPRFQGQGSQVYIDPKTGRMLSRDEYLQVANTTEAVSYRAEQERIAAANAKLFRPGNTLDNPLAGVTDFGGDTAISLLTASPNISAAIQHKSTFVKPYKIINGKLQEVTDADITPQDIASNSVYFYIGGATGGPDRQRMAQLYQSKGDKLVPVGDPSFYQGAHPDQAAMDFARIALPIALSFVPGLGTAIGGALGATGAAAGALGSGVLSFGTQLAMGADPLQALKGAALSAAGGYLGSQISSMLPTEVAGIGKNVITQLVTTGKLDPAALATSVGTSFATDALAAETGMDKATAAKIVTAGLQAIQGNELAALTSLAQAGIQSGLAGTGVTAQSPQDRAAFLEANASPLGLSALSPIAAEDEEIALLQRQNAANQALSDYLGPGNDLSREGLVSQLKNLGFTADQAEGFAIQADQRINMQRVGADVMSRYSKIDPEFGTPQLDRDIAWAEMVAAGFSSDRANEILNGIDAQNAIKLENKLSVQSAYQNFTQGKGSEDQLRSALTSAGYNDAQINELVTRGRGVLEGSKLTSGEQAQIRAENLPDIRSEIAGKSNFNDAYALARDKLGADATFTWQGKTYSTATAAERPDLSGTTSKPTAEVPYVAPNGMHNRAAFIQAGGGTSDADYAKYVQAVNAVIAEGKSGTLITPASVNSTGKEMPSTTGPVTMEKPSVDSVLGSVAAQGVASFGANSIAGVLSALGFTDAGRTVLDKANQIAAAATAAEGADITQGKRDINAAIQRVGESSGIKDFATNVGNLVSTAFNNPKAFGATVGSEVVEEVLQLATLKFPGSFLVKETVASALENGGAAYNTEYESQIAKGASKEDAHLAAQKAAGTAAGVTVALAGGAAGLGKVAGKVFGSQADEAASGVSQVGKTTLRESAQEVLEEGSIAGSIDLALGRPVDAVNALTNMTGGALYGGVTAGSMQGTKLDTLDQAASTSIGSGVQASFNDTLAQTGNIAQASTNSVTTAINNGLDPGAAVSTVIDTAAKSGGDMSAVITASINTGLSTALSSGVDTSTAVSTIVAGSVTASLNNGVNASMAVSSTVGSSVKTGIESGADASTVIASSVTTAVSTATQNGANSTAVVAGSTSTAISTAIASGVDASTAISSAVDSATKAGADTSVATASSITAAVAAGTDTNTAIAAATGANSNITANSTTNNNVTSTVVTDTKTGVTSQTVVDSTNNASTTTTTNNNVTSQVTTVGSTTTTVTSDTSTGVTTQTTVDGTRSTDVTVNTTTNVTTQVVTDTNTNTKVTVEWEPDGETRCTFTDPEGRETVFDDLDVGDPPKVDIVVPLEPVKPEVKPETPKETKPKTSQSGSGSAMMMPAMAGAAAAVDWLGPQFLKSKERGTYVDPLAEFQALQQQADQQQILSQIQPELANVLTERGAMPYYAYGQEPSIDEVLGLPDQESSSYNESDYVPVFKSGGKVSPLNIQMMYAKGGHAREDFRDGKHVAGPGDGQSDDIPAWLADGEFVFPADVVSALGNGSTKAGTEKLYEMMHEIRGRARSKHPKDLPPPAHKSPLDYLKKGK